MKLAMLSLVTYPSTFLVRNKELLSRRAFILLSNEVGDLLVLCLFHRGLIALIARTHVFLNVVHS